MTASCVFFAVLTGLIRHLSATLDPLEGAGPGGADCVAASVGGMLAAEAVLEPIGA